MPLKSPLGSRFAGLPLILCGPIVRRVEPEIASVWVALKEARDVFLELYVGYCTPSNSSFPEKQLAFRSAKTPTIKIGEHLYIALVTIETPGLLTQGGIYSYNLFFHQQNVATEKENLISLNLLKEPELLGFKVGQLPSFIVAPTKLEELRIAHGSCRKPHGRGRDALATLERIIKPDFTEAARMLKPTARPHCLFHTGDQIYADDCSNFLIQLYNDAGNFLFQKVEQLPFPKNADQDALKQTATLTPVLLNTDPNYLWIDATAEAFPPTRRATNFYSGFTGDESNHLYSLAEFSAAYLFQWCDVLWPTELPDSKDIFTDRILDHPKTRTYLLGLDIEGKVDNKGDEEVPANWNNLSPSNRAAILGSNTIIQNAQNKFVEAHQATQDNLEPKEKERVQEFQRTLKDVRRVLANVSSIMSFDDHDVTDDWYENGGWARRALGNRLGETIIRNGLLSFALFQGWGNDPKGWADETTGRNDRFNLLKDIQALTAAFKAMPPAADPTSTVEPPWHSPFATKFHEALGFADFDKPLVKWHCFLRLGAAKVFVLDTRTRRDFSAGLDFPANLIRPKALTEQIPDNAMPFGAELAIVVSGAPALGLAAIESIGQPIISRVLDVMNAYSSIRSSAEQKTKDVLNRKSGHTGRDSMDVEHWSLHPTGFEAMLKRCATLKKVLFLSGDVHYGITSEMDYWIKDAPQAARFVQMVSSSLKNIKPEGALMGILPSGTAQLALSGGLNREFANLTALGWEKPEDIAKLKLRVRTAPTTFVNASPRNVPIQLARALSKNPALVSLRGWPLKEFPQVSPSGKPTVLPRLVFKADIPEPSFRWRLNVLPDLRPDSERFKSFSNPPPNLGKDLVKGDTTSSGYKSGLLEILERGAFYSRSHINRFVNWYSHVAIIDFVKKDNDTLARQSMFFNAMLSDADADTTGTYENPILQYIASLTAKPASEKPDFPLEPHA